MLKHYRGIICSPFPGGATIELNLANRGIPVWGYDNFEPVANFWSCVLENPGRVAAYVDELYPLSKREFYDLRSRYRRIHSPYRRAAVYFVLNRASFNGCAFTGGMTLDRFTGSAIERLRNFHVDNLTVEQVDFRESIPRHSHSLLVLDPPYFGVDALYGFRGELQRDFDHHALYEILRARDDWLLFYNDHPMIRDLYCRHRKVRPRWSYGMSKDKRSRELLIINTNINEAALSAMAA